MNKFKVPIKNVLFMYSYIWDRVNNKDFINLSSEDDFDSSNIYAELFLINIKRIIKKGLYKEYIEKNEELNTVKGKLDIQSIINKQTLRYGKVYCDYDELIENNLLNQIIKYIAIRLYKSTDISKDNKKKLNRIILYFNQVDYVEIDKYSFDKINFNKSNYYYFYMIKICQLIYNSQMLSESSGKYSFYNLFDNDENMNNVFELFVYKFYEQELPKKKYKVKYQSQLNWNVSSGNKSLLPIMKMDTFIKSNEETIILDTKYYKDYLTTNYDKESLISGNMYQMMAYLNNVNATNDLKGILLYPLPFNGEPIYESYDVKVVSQEMGAIDAKIQFNTIDLSQDWRKITCDLLKIIDKDIANEKANQLNELYT